MFVCGSRVYPAVFCSGIVRSRFKLSTPSRTVNRRTTTEVLIREEQLAQRVRELGDELSQDYMGRVPILVGILKGSAIFLADLIRRLSIDCEVDFLSISSYGNRTRTSGSIQLLKDLDHDIFERDVIVIEDIVDSGHSLAYIRRSLAARGPRSVSIVSLLDKRERRETSVYVDYVGFTIPDHFVVGYGLDYAERYRGLPYIGILSPEEIEAGARLNGSGNGDDSCSSPE